MQTTFGFKEKKAFPSERIDCQNFRDGRSISARTDGKEAVNGFPTRNSGEEEDVDFQQKETDGSGGTIG